MPNLKLQIEYQGSCYCGWQIQNHPRSLPRQKKSIQEIIEKTLRRILQEKVTLIGSGRTDAGVHAAAQVANFKTCSCIPPEKLLRALNGLLPDDISVSKVEEVYTDFDSCRNAKSKVYRYTILNRRYPSALLKERVYFYPYFLSVSLMRREAKMLLGRHNFKSFQASDKIERQAVRRIKEIKVVKKGDFIHIDIEADGFLYNMVRNIVGTLIEIGRGRFKKGSLKKILLAKDRRLAGPTAPSRGLCLLEVKY